MKEIISIVILITSFMTANAQQYGDEGPTLVPNAFGLVYEDAIGSNVDGQVNVHKVNYTVEGIKVVANVYTPAGYDARASYPAVVVAHSNGGSKDQVAGLYAQRLAEAGFVTLAFDARFQGESGGEPRMTDKPFYRMGDIMGAVDFIQNYPGVDADRVGALGICGGGGYTFAAAQVDKRIKAVATISLFNTGDVRRNGYMRTQMNNIFERQAEVSMARQAEAKGATPQPAGFANMTPEEARNIKVDLYREGYFYYSVTHKTPHATGAYLKSSLMDMMAWTLPIMPTSLPSPCWSSPERKPTADICRKKPLPRRALQPTKNSSLCPAQRTYAPTMSKSMSTRSVARYSVFSMRNFLLTNNYRRKYQSSTVKKYEEKNIRP